jgi:hypothetical protein
VSPVAAPFDWLAGFIRGEFDHTRTGGRGMFESLFVLTLFGVLYVDIIEFLEKCDHPQTSAVQEIRLDA